MLKIRELRKDAKISQARLAAMSGVKQPTVVAWEKNESQPKADKLPVIAKALGCEIADLYDEEETV